MKIFNFAKEAPYYGGAQIEIEVREASETNTAVASNIPGTSRYLVKKRETFITMAQRSLY